LSSGPHVIPWPRLLPALATGGLLWLCHFPVACGWLAWLALVPLLCLVRSDARPRRLYLCAWAGGLVFFWPVLQWMRVADVRMYATWAGLATYCSLYCPLAIALIRQLDRRTPLPLVVTVPAVWTALELLRAHFGTGFPWYFLGHTQHAVLPLIQVADLAGAYAVTFLVAAVNALLFELLYRRRWFRRLLALPAEPVLPRRPVLAWQAAAVGLLLAGALAYGFWRLGQDDFDLGPRLALVQTNMPQGIRNAQSGPGEQAKSATTVMMSDYQRLSRIAADQRPALIVWPETSYPSEWDQMGEAYPLEDDGRRADWQAAALREWNKSIIEDVRAVGVPSLLGMTSRVFDAPEKARRHNSAVLLQGDGQFAGRYDKIHRVPFGEYVPLREALPWMNAFAPYDFDYSVSAGEQFTRFPLGDYRFGVLICYEDTDPYLARQYVSRGRGSGVGGQGNEGAVDFLVNISNDGWFDGTSEHEEHLAICRFRAVECRRSVARAVNMGISAVIDGNGRVRAPRTIDQVKGQNVSLWDMDDEVRWNVDVKGYVIERPWYWRMLGFKDQHVDANYQAIPLEVWSPLPTSRWRAFKKVQGVLTASVPIDRRTSLYAQWGDWLPWSCWGLVGIGLVGRWMRRGPDASAKRR
jgi:apolipoprotein N-acyltransferase